MTTVAGISGNVTTVAGMSAAITTVNSNSSNINTVAGANSNITSVSDIFSEIRKNHRNDIYFIIKLPVMKQYFDQPAIENESIEIL